MTERSLRIHLMGACGTGMGSLALLLKEAGHRVDGSDEGVYPPMSDVLARAGIAVAPYHPDRLGAPGDEPDLVVVGNAVSLAKNEQVRALFTRRLAFTSMPRALIEFAVRGRRQIVVTGTHGKTTTTSLTAHVLAVAGIDPGFFIGGVAQNFGVNARLGSGDAFVIEGDEYDTACFDKRSKFLHFSPSAAVLTSIEFDHADIYRDLGAVRAAFRTFLEGLAPTAVLAACLDDNEVRAATAHTRARVVGYGFADDAAVRADDLRETAAGTAFWIRTAHGSFEAVSPLAGRHNVLNALGAYVVCAAVGVSDADFARGLATFAGVKRRLEPVGEAGGVLVLDDFAHHPTAIRETIAAVRARHPDRRLIAVFDPRSNTTRRRVFQAELAACFAGAAAVIVSRPEQMEKIPADDRIDIDRLAADIGGAVGRAFVADGPDDAVARTVSLAAPGDVVLAMSNGGFGGFPRKLVAALGGGPP